MVLHFEYGTRSSKEGRDWICNECNNLNKARERIVFNIPQFKCLNCGRSYFKDNTLNFSLGDVKVNAECMATACVKAMEITYLVECVKKQLIPDPQMVVLDPWMMYTDYKFEYPLRSGKDSEEQIRNQDSVHKFIKMALKLRDIGIGLEDDTFYRVGDVSMILKTDYESMCDEFANGVPLLGVIGPGISFGEVENCEFYFPPTVEEFHQCNERPPPHKAHEAHMVLLIGPAEQDGVQGFHFVNSRGAGWCPREVLDGTPNAAAGGLSKIPHDALFFNVVKLWAPGESANRPMRLEDEDEDDEDDTSTYFNKYFNLERNRAIFLGDEETCGNKTLLIPLERRAKRPRFF